MRRLLPLLGIVLGACYATSPRDATPDRSERAAYRELENNSGSIAPNERLSAERESYRWQAEDWQAGRVKQLQDNTLVLAPYLAGIGTIPLQLEPDTPVFRGNTQVSRAQLTPGTEIRANFHNDTGLKRAVSVEILTPADAERMRGKFEGTADD